VPAVVQPFANQDTETSSQDLFAERIDLFYVSSASDEDFQLHLLGEPFYAFQNVFLFLEILKQLGKV
jgi:hypothetical protein